MASNSFCPKVKMGKPGRHFVSWLYEREGQNRQPVPRKSTGRELLVICELAMGAVGPAVPALKAQMLLKVEQELERVLALPEETEPTAV
jgi:hypothetical protein